MTVLPLLFLSPTDDSKGMDTFLTILALIALFVLLALPPLYWHVKDRATDRRVRLARVEHELRELHERRSPNRDDYSRTN